MRNKQKNGFTLVELLIAMVVGLTILLAISSMMDIGLKSSSGVGRRVLTQQDARAVLDLMAMEIGMASFNPTYDITLHGARAQNMQIIVHVLSRCTGVPSPFVQQEKEYRLPLPIKFWWRWIWVVLKLPTCSKGVR